MQDPTFNSVALGPSGEMLGVAEIQYNYQNGLDVNWVQDASVGEPDMNTYEVPPRELFGIAVYHLYDYPQGDSRLRGIWLRFLDRLNGNVKSVILTSEDFPITDSVTGGAIDRVLLGGVLVFILIALFAGPGKRKK